MTDCEREEIRDLLPELAAGVLSSAEQARVEAHVRSCTECAAELAIIRTARATRPRAIAIDAAAIVAKLPRPSSPERNDVVSLDAHRARQQTRKASSWSSRSVWRAAATIGVMIVGGWSVLIVRSGGIGMITSGRVDSTKLSDEPVASAPTTAPVAVVSASADTPAVTAPKVEKSVSVSFGGLSDYTDEELQAVLDRLDKWDGATSTEANTTTPILSVKNTRSPE